MVPSFLENLTIQIMNFIYRGLKAHTTTSIMKKNQCLNLTNYLKNHVDDKDGQIITLYDQMLVPLSQEEIKQFINDLEEIESNYH
jgi:hypothetical protein